MALRVPKLAVKCMPMRMYISIICCSGVILSFMLRFCLSLCILRMVKTRKHQTFSSDCFNDSMVNQSHPHPTGPGAPEFDWSEEEQGYIMSSIFLTYFLFQIPAGYFTDMIGAVPITAGGMLLSSVVSLITPEVARLTGWIGLTVLRSVMGAGQALAFIPLHSIVNAWIPKKERGTWGAIIFSGSHLGSCINMLLTGQLLSVVVWHWVFRLYGLIGFLWIALFLFTCYSYPDQCKYVSEKEKKIFEENGQMVRKKHPSPPWFKILTNVPMWAAIAATFAHAWVLFSLLTDLPKFLKSVLHISIETNSLVNAGMYILIWANAVGSGPIVDLIHKKQLVSVSWNRKIFVSISSLPPAMGLVWSVHTNCNVALAVAVLLIGCSLLGYFYSSGKLMGIDMSPHYSGTVSSIVNALGTTAGFIATIVTGHITPNEALVEWRVVMWIALAIMFIGNVIFLIWGSSEVQPFDSPQAAEEAKERRAKKYEEKQKKKEEKKLKEEEKQRLKQEGEIDEHPSSENEKPKTDPNAPNE